MIPRNLSSTHIKKTIICGPYLTLHGQENSLAQPGGEDDDGSITSTEERQRSSSPPVDFSSDYKTVAQ